ncbi:DUF2934 domain-containing protein [Salinisphaera sp. RV14]|uniref:DUF2934 domain-containing protein n=1 Tax=unclassified Salinisphaera TaxID=2649847 RepID=UPI003F86A3FE
MAKKSNAPVTEHDIRQRSYFIWESESYPEGKEEEHWFRAEAELLSAATKKPEKAKKSAGPDMTTSKAPSKPSSKKKGTSPS